VLVLGEERAATAAPKGRVVRLAEILVSCLIDEDEKGIEGKVERIIHGAIRFGYPCLESSYQIPRSRYDFSCNMALVIDFHGLARFFMT
jgi:hypothetical protein